MPRNRHAHERTRSNEIAESAAPRRVVSCVSGCGGGSVGARAAVRRTDRGHAACRWGGASNASDPTAAAAPSTSDDDLVKKTQNPVSDLISVPFQFNLSFPSGNDDDGQLIVNIQPVIPISLNEDWNLIARTILPVIYLPSPVASLDDESGIGDLQFTAFASPKESGEWIWGVGPVLRFPTASEDILGSEQWSAGPSAVVLRMDGPWVYGALFQHVWSFAGDDDRSHVSETLIQPFVNYNLPDGWYLTASPVITYNWAADDSDDALTLPIGGGFGKVHRFGNMPVNLQIQAFHNTVRPDDAPEWTVRFQVQLLFPK